MSFRTCWSLVLTVVLGFGATAQTVLFDFENAPYRSPLPLSLSVGGITAQFSATGSGFSIQRADTMGFTPAGFSGLCIYPSSVYASDLIITFTRPLIEFSILYAPQELACDSSARMRVTAYLQDASVGTATTNAEAGTWPSQILAIHLTQTFDQVVVHYDAPPPTGGDWGPIFMADNMNVTAAPEPPVLVPPELLPDGSFQLSFQYTPGVICSVWGTTDVALTFNAWSRLGAATEKSPGFYQFTDTMQVRGPQQFYRVSSP